MTGRSQRAWAIGVTLVVVAVVIAGLRKTGSPAEARLKLLDKARVSDLQRLADKVAVYQAKSGRLPLALDSVRVQSGDTSGYHDPVTSIPYDYRISDDTSFDLCATFDGTAPGEYEMDNWDHQSGHQCFHRIITPKSAR